MNITLIVILSVVAGILYRMGGSSKFNTLYRDIGCSLVSLALCLVLGLKAGLWATLGAYFLTFGLTWGALSAYWGQDEKKFGYWAHGLGLALAILPIAFITGHWIGFGIRVVGLTFLTALWSEIIGWDIAEEFGRGFLLTATIPLLMI